jgi:hypothetical protein
VSGVGDRLVAAQFGAQIQVLDELSALPQITAIQLTTDRQVLVSGVTGEVLNAAPE